MQEQNFHTAQNAQYTIDEQALRVERQEGFNTGFEAGFQAGYDQGWKRALETQSESNSPLKKDNDWNWIIVITILVTLSTLVSYVPYFLKLIFGH
jgi:hypothetical protein